MVIDRDLFSSVMNPSTPPAITAAPPTFTATAPTRCRATPSAGGASGADTMALPFGAARIAGSARHSTALHDGLRLIKGDCHRLRWSAGPPYDVSALQDWRALMPLRGCINRAAVERHPQLRGAFLLRLFQDHRGTRRSRDTINAVITGRRRSASSAFASAACRCTNDPGAGPAFLRRGREKLKRVPTVCSKRRLWTNFSRASAKSPLLHVTAGVLEEEGGHIPAFPRRAPRSRAQAPRLLPVDARRAGESNAYRAHLRRRHAGECPTCWRRALLARRIWSRLVRFCRRRQHA